MRIATLKKRLESGVAWLSELMTLAKPAPCLSLNQRLCDARAMIESVPKNGENKHHGFEFATHDDVAEVCRKALDEVGVAMWPSMESVQDLGGKLVRVWLTYEIVCKETGESKTVRWSGLGHDSQDKGQYKAITQAKKTFLLNLFLIPTGDLEADSDTGLNKPDNRGQRQGNSQGQKDPWFKELPDKRQDSIRKKFHAVANKIEWGPKYQDYTEWCAQNNLLGYDEEKGKVSITGSRLSQVDRTIKAMELQLNRQTEAKQKADAELKATEDKAVAAMRQEQANASGLSDEDQAELEGLL